MKSPQTIIVRNSIVNYALLVFANAIGLLVAVPLGLVGAWMLLSEGCLSGRDAIAFIVFALVALYCTTSLRTNLRQIRDRQPVLSLTPTGLIVHRTLWGGTGTQADLIIPWVDVARVEVVVSTYSPRVSIRYNRLPGYAEVELFGLTHSPAAIGRLIDEYLARPQRSQTTRELVRSTDSAKRA